MKKQELLELIRQVVKEEQDYQDLFKTMLDKTSVELFNIESCCIMAAHVISFT